MGRPQDEMVAYYESRAPVFDTWWETKGEVEGRTRPGWDEELRQLTQVVASLRPVPTLDVGCGTGYVTRLLPSPRVVGLDPSPAMLRLARSRLPLLALVRGSAFDLPFTPLAFARVFTSHVFGHALEPARFLAEARRVGHEIVVVDAGPRGGPPREEWQDRSLADGSRHRVYKRFFTGPGLRAELGGGRVLHDGRWFVAVASP
jgi:ubiquinone/menaquinone biosynthesis C-methylase UbiE